MHIRCCSIESHTQLSIPPNPPIRKRRQINKFTTIIRCKICQYRAATSNGRFRYGVITTTRRHEQRANIHKSRRYSFVFHIPLILFLRFCKCEKPQASPPAKPYSYSSYTYLLPLQPLFPTFSCFQRNKSYKYSPASSDCTPDSS